MSQERIDAAFDKLSDRVIDGDSGEPLSPHCYYCGLKECIEGRFLTRICPEYIKDHTEENE